MILTLKGADFSASNIGALNGYTVSINGTGIIYSGPSYVEKNAALSGTITLQSGYTLTSATVTMGGNPVTSGVTVGTDTVTLNITNVTGNVIVTVVTVGSSTGGGEEETATLTLTQGYATGTVLDNALNTRVKTNFIEGAFSISLNDGYVIRAIYKYTSPAVSNGTEVVASSQLLTSYTNTDSTGFYIITICKTDATASISPTENIVKSFSGVIYESETSVDGIEISMGQILSSGINSSHSGRAYTVTPLNDKTQISTAGSDFVMIPIIDEDGNLSNGSSTLYTSSDGTFNNSGNGTLEYHDTIKISDIKAISSTAKIYVMFKALSVTIFTLDELLPAITIV